MHVHWLLLPGRRTHLGRRNCCCFCCCCCTILFPPCQLCMSAATYICLPAAVRYYCHQTTLADKQIIWEGHTLPKLIWKKKALLDDFGFRWTQRPKSQNFPEYTVIHKNFPSNFKTPRSPPSSYTLHCEPKKTIRRNWRTARPLSPTKYFNIYRCTVNKLNPSCLRFDLFIICSCSLFVFSVVLVFHLNDISGSI